MSWYREVKILFTITSQIFFFIIWNIVTSIFFGNYVEHRMFIVSTIGVFILLFIKAKYIKDNKYRNKKIIALVSVISLISVTILWLFVGNKNILLNGIYILGINIIHHNFDEETMEYSTYRHRMIKAGLILTMGSVFTMFSKSQVIDELFRYFIFLIVTGIILLRESRRFTYKIREGKAHIYNAIISAFIIIISFDKIYINFMNGITSAFDFTVNIFMRLIELLLEVVLKILSNPLQYLLNLISDKFGKNYGEVLDRIIANRGSDKEKINPIIVQTKEFPLIAILLKVLIFALVVYILYKIFIGRKYTIKENNDMMNEEREKILINKKKKHIFENFIRKITGRRTNKEKILDIYKDFERVTEIKKIFKPYMTSTQLSNVTKIHVEKVEELDHMSEIYNEAKFSTHNIKDDKLRVMKNDYNRIKKEL